MGCLPDSPELLLADSQSVSISVSKTARHLVSHLAINSQSVGRSVSKMASLFVSKLDIYSVSQNCFCGRIHYLGF